MQTIQDSIIHESSTHTECDHLIKIHGGPNILVSGDVIYRCDNVILLSCPHQNLFHLLQYDYAGKKLSSQSSKCILDLGEYPSEIRNRACLNISIKEQSCPDFDIEDLESIQLFDDPLADHLNWVANNDYLDSNSDATLFFDGTVLSTYKEQNIVSCGPYSNLMYSCALLKLNPNRDFAFEYGIVFITYAVPSKHINDVESFEVPEPQMQYHAFTCKEDARTKLKSLSTSHHFPLQAFVQKLN